eukprot:m.73969 g.73969  ORF g.73969 m.73969 type:complete len:412 (+) comp8876_c0_seq3:1087-2322(+)
MPDNHHAGQAPTRHCSHMFSGGFDLGTDDGADDFLEGMGPVQHGDLRRIAVMTCGGDCPGLNAVIRAVAFNAYAHGLEVYGVLDGLLGLVEDRIERLNRRDVSDILVIGGTVLGSNNKTDPSRVRTGKTTPDGEPEEVDMTQVCADNLKRRGIGCLVVVGGDGTMSAVKLIVERGVHCIGVPKTIDNDCFATEVTVGFSTAVATATEAMDRVRTTAASHHRVMVVELMGRQAGWITLHAGIAAAANIILLPEIPFDLDAVCAVCAKQGNGSGRNCTIVAVAEGARPHDGKQIIERIDKSSAEPIRLGGVGKWLSTAIENKTKIESRYVVLGHVIRGGAPIASDRVLATSLGHHAMNLVHARTFNRLVVVQGGKITDVDITVAANKQRLVPVDDPLIKAARGIGTSFAEVAQ